MATVVCPVIISVLFHVSNISPISLCEPETCPFCYGDNFCNEVKENITLKYDSFSSFVFNLLSVKNVYFGEYGDSDIIIKKLVHSSYFDKLKEDILKFSNLQITKKHLEEVICEKTSKFQVCDRDTSTTFMHKFVHKNNTHTWTILKVNVEPLLLELFSQENNWPVPKLFGYCGRSIVVENCGIPLNEISSFSWYDRAYVALQLLNAAEKFTFDHDTFRMYLLDISPDNIVVNPLNLRVAFVDLEHVLLQKKSISNISHYTNHFEDETYAFSTDQICSSDVSDHNVYSVCWLLLSQRAPWPMMRNGLLHSSPATLDVEKLFINIELCVNSNMYELSRFHYSAKIKELLSMLSKHSG